MNTAVNLDGKADGNSPQIKTSTKPADPITIPCTATNICQLNDDCLVYIFKNLNFVDQFSFARSCDRFHHAFSLSFRINYKVFEVEHVNWKNFTMKKMRELLSLVGKHIAVIDGNPTKCRNTFKLLSTFCPNVSSLKLGGALGTGQLDPLVNSMQMITDLYLYGYEETNIDRDILVLKKLSQLKKFSVFAKAISGKYLSELTTLELLCLSECHCLQSNYLSEMFKALVDLQTLSITGCSGLKVDVCRQMVRYSTKLKSLEIDPRACGFKILARFPSLTQLTLYTEKMVQPIDSNFAKIFKELANHADKLEHLELVGKTVVASLPRMLDCIKNLKVLSFDICQFIDDEFLKCFCKMENLQKLKITCNQITINDGLLHLLTNCKHLSHVEIETVMANRINAEFVHKTILILRKTIPLRTLPVTLILGKVNKLTTGAEYDKAVEDGIIKIIFQSDNNDSNNDRYDRRDHVTYDYEGWMLMLRALGLFD